MAALAIDPTTEVQAVVLGQENICGLRCTAVRLPTIRKLLVVMIDELELDSSIVIEDRYDAYPWPSWSTRVEVIGAAAAHRAAVFSLMAEKGFNSDE